MLRVALLYWKFIHSKQQLYSVIFMMKHLVTKQKSAQLLVATKLHVGQGLEMCNLQVMYNVRVYNSYYCVVLKDFYTYVGKA